MSRKSSGVFSGSWSAFWHWDHRVVAYKLGANASHGGAQTAFGPMERLRQDVGFDGGFACGA